jgi:hypothetical protein
MAIVVDIPAYTYFLCHTPAMLEDITKGTRHTYRNTKWEQKQTLQSCQTSYWFSTSSKMIAREFEREVRDKNMQ